ncbi:CcdB family protein [Maricaulis maris]|uniref:Toxin CcdB n=1 Tax=Maricaulis maris TaxID=74318 RepID=A0A495DNN1_9PROT|nr:CcdB family protein [Maricaulis maris]RKR03639.1 toxin CcdB [Maricaulis maris]
MARFDVHPLKGSGVALVVDIQAHLLSELPSRIVVPLLATADLKRPPISRLEPILDIDGEAYLFATAGLGVQSANQLGTAIANVEARHRDDIVNALDFLFQGY